MKTTTLARPGPVRRSAVVPLAAMGAALSILLWVQPLMGRHLSRHRLVESSRQISYQLHSASQAARETGRPVVVVPDLAGGSLSVFLERDGDLVPDQDELVYGPRRQLSLQLPDGVFFPDPDAERAVTGSRALDGLTPVPASRDRVAVFEADGRIRNPGAIRISDDRIGRRNVLEIRLRRESARVEISKLIYDHSGGRTSFVPFSLRGWEWY